jgi:lantibiotic transport system permease protein
MVNIIKAEHQKAKRTMRKKFIWGFPLLTFVMAFIFTLGMTNAYAESVWNWWYTLLLPGMIALFCYLSVAQEKKIKYYHLTTIPTDRRKLLLGKIIYIGCMISISLDAILPNPIPNMIAVNRIEHRHKTSSINSFDKNAAGLSGKDNRF